MNCSKLWQPFISLTLVILFLTGCGFSAGALEPTPPPPAFSLSSLPSPATPTPLPLPAPSPPGHPAALPQPPLTDANAQLAGAWVEISAQPATAMTGDLITLTGRPAKLGLPQYTLYLHREPAIIIKYDGQLIFQGFTGAVVEFISASASQSEVEFILRAAQPGAVEAMIAVSGEVYLDVGQRPTTAFAWSQATSPGVMLTIVPPPATPQPTLRSESSDEVSTPSTGAPLSSDATPAGFEPGLLEGPIEVNFTETQLNPHWKMYTRADGLLGGTTDILIDETGRKWIGGAGLNIFDGQIWQTYSRANVYSDHAMALARDAAGRIWVGYNDPGGLSMFDGQNWHQYTIAWGESGNFVNDLAADQTGRLWFGTTHGLGMFDGQTWTIYQAAPPPGATPFPRPTLTPPAHAPYIQPKVTKIGPDELAYPISAVAVDLAGQVWVGGQGGVDVFDGQSWSRYSQTDGLASNGIMAMAIDPAGRKWFVTYDRGVSVFDGQTWLTYTQADGLADNIIWGLGIDPAGHIWLGAGRVLHEFIPAGSSPALPTPVSYPTPQITDFTVTPTRALTIGDTIFLTWHASGEKAELCFLSGRPVYCQDAPLTGSQTITVAETMLTEAIGGIGLRVTASDIFTWSLAALDFQCLHDWFFAHPEAGCPEAEPVYSRAAAQYFEHGLMIWTEQPDQFYVFFEKERAFTSFYADFVKDSDFLATPEPLLTLPGGLPTPEPWPAAPPPGYFEPVSGFGRVWRYFWRYENDLPVTIRQDIGWATGPEFEFETAYQCALGTAVYGRWSCYLRSPTGKVLSYYPESTIRNKWFWTEVEPK